MLTAIKGMYKDGAIELEEKPQGIGQAAVVVTFLESAVPRDGSSQSEPQLMTFGMLAVQGRQTSTLEDFKDLEYDDSRWDRV